MKGRTWVKLPAKVCKSRASAEVKARFQKRADELIKSVLKPKHLKPPPSDGRFNTIVDIHSRRHGSSVLSAQAAMICSPAGSLMSVSFLSSTFLLALSISIPTN